jgi:AAA domain/Alpha-L-arabinofuranosidase C-terminal domain
MLSGLAAFLASPDLMDDFIDEVVAVADAVVAWRRSAKRIMLSFDEWNVWYRTRRMPEARVRPGWPVAPSILEEIYTMEDALVFGGACIALLNRADRVKVALKGAVLAPAGYEQSPVRSSYGSLRERWMPDLQIAMRVPKIDRIRATTPHRTGDGVLGRSQWFDVDDKAKTHWCPAEGELVVSLLKTIVGNPNPNLFIVTPFRIVADEMKSRLNLEEELFSQGWAKHRVGTIHTFQGREADSVILVLGAPNASQKGARVWAGLTPNIVNVAVSRAKQNL